MKNIKSKTLRHQYNLSDGIVCFCALFCYYGRGSTHSHVGTTPDMTAVTLPGCCPPPNPEDRAPSEPQFLRDHLPARCVLVLRVTPGQSRAAAAAAAGTGSSAGVGGERGLWLCLSLLEILALMTHRALSKRWIEKNERKKGGVGGKEKKIKPGRRADGFSCKV